MANILFLSHSGIDTDSARELRRRILASPTAREAGLQVWLDKDDLRPGYDWQEQIERLITRHSTAFAVLVGSKGTVNWVDREVRLGLSRAVSSSGQRYPFIPILAKDVPLTALPPFAAQFHAVRDPFNNGAEFEKLIRTATGQGQADKPAKIINEPFVGLRAMSEADSNRFFGRSGELDLLVEYAARRRLIAVVADSGSGKSSLVQAGLVPRYRGGALEDLTRQEPDSRVRHVVAMRPGMSPFDNLRAAITAAAERLDLTPVVKQQLRELIDPQDFEKTSYALQCNLPSQETETLFIIDQLEELFTQSPQLTRNNFINFIVFLASSSPLPFRIVTTIRSDYFNLCSSYPDFYKLLSGNDGQGLYRLRQISDLGIAEIVAKPLQMAGHEDEGERQALIEQVERDVSDRPGDLALIQMALFETWKARSRFDGDLNRAYVAVGGVPGALAHAAENVRKRLSRTDQELLIPLLVRLITLGATGGATRRVANLQELDPACLVLARKLSEESHSRLILMGEEHLEICHEQLITQWPWLQEQLNANAVHVRRLHRLIERAQPWSTDTDNRSQHLATGAELSAFDELLKYRPAWPSPTEIAYVEDSNQSRQRDERRKRWITRALAASVLVLTALSGWAVSLKMQADKSAVTAKEQADRADTEANKARERATEAERSRQAAYVNQARAAALAISTSLERPKEVRQALEVMSENISLLEHEGALTRYADLVGAGYQAVAAYRRQPVTLDFSGGNHTMFRKPTFSPKGTFITVDLWATYAPIVDARTGRIIYRLPSPEKVIQHIEFDNSERKILLRTFNFAAIFDANTGHPLGIVEGCGESSENAPDPENMDSSSSEPGTDLDLSGDEEADSYCGLADAALSRDGTTLATAHSDGFVRQWDTGTFKTLPKLGSGSTPLRTVAYSHDRRHVLFTTIDGRVEVWSSDGTRQVYALDSPAAERESRWIYAEFLSSDELLLIGPSLGARIIDFTRGHAIAQLDTDWPTRYSYDDHAGTIALPTSDNSIKIFDVQNGSRISSLDEVPEEATGIAHNTARNLIVVGDRIGNISIFNASTGHLYIKKRVASSEVSSVSFDKDGQNLVIGFVDNTLQIWSAQSLTEFSMMDTLHHTDAISVKGMSVLYGGERLNIYDTSGLHQIGSLETKFSGSPFGDYDAVRVGFDNKIAIPSEDGCSIYDVGSQPLTVDMKGCFANPTAFPVDPSLRSYLKQTQTGLEIVDSSTGVAESVFDVEVTWASFDVSGKHILARATDGRVISWSHDPTSADQRPIGQRRGDVLSLAEGAQISASAVPGRFWARERHGPIIVIDAGLQEKIGELPGSEDSAEVYGLPDNHIVASIVDGAIRVWNLKTMTMVAEIEWKTGRISAIGLTSDNLMALATETGLVTVWNLDPTIEVARWNMGLNCGSFDGATATNPRECVADLSFHGGQLLIGVRSENGSGGLFTRSNQWWRWQPDEEVISSKPEEIFRYASILSLKADVAADQSRMRRRDWICGGGSVAKNSATSVLDTWTLLNAIAEGEEYDQYEEMREACLDILSKEPDRSVDRTKLSFVLMKQGRIDESREALIRAANSSYLPALHFMADSILLGLHGKRSKSMAEVMYKRAAGEGSRMSGAVLALISGEGVAIRGDICALSTLAAGGEPMSGMFLAEMLSSTPGYPVQISLPVFGGSIASVNAISPFHDAGAALNYASRSARSYAMSGSEKLKSMATDIVTEIVRNLSISEVSRIVDAQPITTNIQSSTDLCR